MKKINFDSLSNSELLERINTFKAEIATIRFDLASGKSKKTHQLKQTRHNLARVLTIAAKRAAAQFNTEVKEK